MTGISFARAADYYDATRGLPAPVQTQLADLLVAELDGRGRCLEIGVGTGRIALPLHERGVDLVGIDLATPMLARLIDNAGRPPFPLLAADATRLPFRSSSFGAVLACHVLHLIPAWQQAIDEALRMLRPGGALLVDFGGGTDAPWSKATTEIAAGHGVRAVRPGVSDPDVVAGYLTGRATVRPLPTISLAVTRTLAGDLHDWEHQLFSWTWPYPPEQLTAVCDDVRRWAHGEGVDLNLPADGTRTLRWTAFEVPA